MHYLDNAATTFVLPEVVEVIQNTLSNHFANPSSLYKLGFEAEQIITKSRSVLANALGCKRDELYFTASGTESSNIALLGAIRARKNWGKHVVCTGYEHPCVQNTLAMLAKTENYKITLIAPNANGEIDPVSFVNAITANTVLASAMHVNNETGAIIDVAHLADAVKQKNPRTAFHVDGVQAFTKLPLALSATKIDSYGVSGHKLHAPKGIAALYLRAGYNLLPPFAGGGQEKNKRPGTENTAYIAGFATAVQHALQNQAKTNNTIAALRAQLINGLQVLPAFTQNGPINGYAGIINFSLAGVKSQTLLNFLAQNEVYVSSGSACDKGEKSHTLSAMNLPADRIDCALRISFDGYNTADDISALLACLSQGITSLAGKK